MLAPIPPVPRVDEGRCTACAVCEARGACRAKAVLVVDRGEPPFIDANRCRGCLVCIPACSSGAIVTRQPATVP